MSCPDAPSGPQSFCLNNNKGKPVCASAGACFPCKRNGDFVADFGPTANCIKKCRTCHEQGEPTTSACFVPFTAPLG